MKSSRHWLYLEFVLFFFFEFLCEMLEAADIACLEGQSLCDSSALHGLRKCVHQQQIMGERWLTSSKISNDVDGKPCSRWPWGNRSHIHMLNVFLWWEGKGPGYGFKWKTRCVLYCILLPFCIAFNCQLDLQWENYTMLVFCFIMLLFLIFQNIRNFILLYVMAENTSFVEVLEIFSSPETNKSDVKNWCSLSFPISIHLWVKKTPIKTA